MTTPLLAEAPALTALPPPDTPTDDEQRFAALQTGLADQYRRLFPRREAARTVIVVPSMTMDAEVLMRLRGVWHYEERLLCLLLLLRMPRTRLVYVTSQQIAPSIIDYYLHLLPGIPGNHARQRLTLFNCHDASPIPLTQKILARPRLIERLRAEVADPAAAHLTCFNVTDAERALSVRLGLPIYGCDPQLQYLGSKSGSRTIFRAAGVNFPDGEEDLRDDHDIADALAALKRRNPTLGRAVVKLNEGFSGEGNALFHFHGAPEGPALAPWVAKVLPTRLRFEAGGETWPHYRAKFGEMGGIVEAFVEGAHKRSPSAQCRITPAGEPQPISTHDQVLGGPTGQLFLGCRFPAAKPYRLDVQEAGLRVAHELAGRGVLGRFGIDFVTVREGDAWRHYAIEINLRKGGTTHPFVMLQFLTDGTYDEETGLYRTPMGHPRYYYASDNLEADHYRGLTPEDLVDIAVCHRLHFHGASQQGVVFHLIGALSEFGKLGVVCIGDTRERARSLYANTYRVLDLEGRAAQS